MAGVAVGVDFGTSNTAAALPGGPGGVARILDVDPAGDDARLLRSVLFYPEDTRDVLVGGEAIRRYLAEGEGRFLQSIKSFLPSTTFVATEIRRKTYKLEDLVAVLLVSLRRAIEREAGATIESAVFGRPAVFSTDADKDRLAEQRLRAAAELAGFPSPRFVIEPIAAALRYEETLGKDELVLVGDFGAGTSDFTLMRLGPARGVDEDRRRDVVASSGVRIGGDRFDAAIVQHRLLPLFGHGATYMSFAKRLELPVWMTRKLLAWHELAFLRERSTMSFLHKAQETADRPEAIGRLITLAEENLAYHLYRSVEAAKRELSACDATTLSFHEADIDVDVKVTRREFDAWTAPLREELMESVDRCLAGAHEPDAIFLTGGTSKIPSVRRMFVERFGEARIREGDAFTSVAAGLGRAAGLAGI